MFGLGTQEIIIILVVALILFGPKKLPEIGRAIGQGIRELKNSSKDIVDTIQGVVENTEEEKPKETVVEANQPIQDKDNKEEGKS